MTEIKYKDLSAWLKVAVISSYIAGGLIILSFIIGFIEGLIGA